MRAMSETNTHGTAVVSFEHGGVTWFIPADLLALQRAWDAAAGAVDTLVEGDDIEALAVARAGRLDLTDQLYRHPWMGEQFKLGRRHQADQALKACARSR